MAAEPGPSLAVVLFTDVVGSTAQRAALGEERADGLRQVHDRLLSERIEAQNGRVVKGLGDGLMAVFASASDALTAAVEAQQAVCVHNQRPDAIAALSVRMGLSVGDVSWENGECFGTPAVEAARLVAEADGGQILCTDFVRVMARGRGGHRFSPLGPLTLKGLPEPVEACEVSWDPPEHLAAERLPFPRSLSVRSPLTFVEREEELAVAERHLATQDGMRVVWLVGEPGIGKTRLAAEFARRAYDRGCDVLFGRCDEDLVVPFQPFLSALRDFVAATAEAVLPERLGNQPMELARLHPALAAHLPGLTPLPADEPAVERYRLFEAVRSWLADTATTRPLLLVVDDLHWADTATVALLAHLVRAADPVPLRIVGTLRDTEPANEEFRRLIDDVAPLARTIALEGLGTSGVRRLVETATGRSSAWDATGLADQIVQETRGNPLFVAAMLTGISADARACELPADVAAAARRRLSRLPAPAQDLLRVASIVGLEFDLRVVGRLLGLPAADALEAADAAVRGHLAEEVGVNHFRFSHGLVRSALRQEIGASRAAHYHGLIAEALEAVHAARLDRHLDELAYHYGEALAGGGPVDRALHYTRAAADRAAAQYALETAADRYRRTLELLALDGQAGGRTHCEVMVALGTAELNARSFAEARETLRQAATDADRANFPDLLAEASAQFVDAVTYPGLPGEEVVDLCRRAAERLDAGDSSHRARLLTGQARGLAFTARAAEALPVLDEAIGMARRVYDRRALGRSLFSVALTSLGPEHMPRRLEATAEALEIAREEDDRILLRDTLSVRASVLLEAGRMRELRELVAEIDEVTRELPNAWVTNAFQNVSGTLALVAGRLADAEALAVAARDGARWSVDTDAEGIYGVQMFGVRREQGRLDAIAPALRAMVTIGGAEAWAPGLAAVHAELGLRSEAQGTLESLITPPEVRLPKDSRRSLSLSYLADAAVFVEDRSRAAVLYRELLPYAGLCITTYFTACYGPALRYLGMLATTLGRFGDAETHFHDALAGCERLESPLWTAHTQYQFARMLLTRRRPGDVGQAERLARVAQETAAGLGMRALEGRAGRLLESGLDVAPRP